MWARDEDGDGIQEVHTNTIEGVWTGVRNFLHPFRRVNKLYLQQDLATHEWAHNLKEVILAFSADFVWCHTISLMSQHSSFVKLKLQRVCPVTHVLVAFEGWNKPWENDGGKPIPLSKKSTISAIVKTAMNSFNDLKAKDSKMLQHRFTAQAYATDTDDDVKTLGSKPINF